MASAVLCAVHFVLQNVKRRLWLTFYVVKCIATTDQKLIVAGYLSLPKIILTKKIVVYILRSKMYCHHKFWIWLDLPFHKIKMSNLSCGTFYYVKCKTQHLLYFTLLYFTLLYFTLLYFIRNAKHVFIWILIHKSLKKISSLRSKN